MCAISLKPLSRACPKHLITDLTVCPLFIAAITSEYTDYTPTSIRVVPYRNI